MKKCTCTTGQVLCPKCEEDLHELYTEMFPSVDQCSRCGRITTVHDCLCEECEDIVNGKEGF